MDEKVMIGARLLRPYYSRALSSLTPVETREVPTLAVDKYWRLYYNPDYLASLPEKQRAGSIACHEVEHLLRKHHTRGELAQIPPKLANICGDAEINDDAEDGVLPSDCIFPKNLIKADGTPMKDGLLMEEYAEELPVTKVPCPGCGSGSGGEKGEYELPAPGGEGDHPGLTPAEADVVRKQVAEDVKAYAGKHPGTVPAGIVMWADSVAEEVNIDWHRQLATTVARVLTSMKGRDDYSWRRAKQRGAALLPSLTKAQISVDVVVDTSGSMANDGDVVLGTERSLQRTGAKVKLISCDAEAKRMKGRQHTGGGGTDLRRGFEICNAPIVVCITDCFTPWPEVKPAKTVVVVAVGDSPGESPDWATRIVVPPRRKR